MLVKVLATGIVLLLPVLFSLTKSASYADQRLEDFHDAFLFTEECNGKTSEES